MSNCDIKPYNNTPINVIQFESVSDYSSNKAPTELVLIFNCDPMILVK